MMKLQTHFALLDEGSKKEIRRTILKAVAIPGYQVPFASREMPIARGWGTGGLQITLSIIGKQDVLKVIDQGADESVNAVNIKKLVANTTGVETTEQTADASIIQSRHRIPEVPLSKNQIIVLQVPIPEPLRAVEPSEFQTKSLHAEQEYSGAWLMLFEQIMKYGKTATDADHPVFVHDRYVMAPSPIPKYDNHKIHQSEALLLFGAGREKKIYAVPPYTNVTSLAFEDYPFEVESFEGKACHLCQMTEAFMDEIVDPVTEETYYQCNDTSACLSRLNENEARTEVDVQYVK